jgi:YfiH family protein
MPLLLSALLQEAGFAHAFPEVGIGDAELVAAVLADRIVQVKQMHGAETVLGSAAAGAEADAIVARAAEGPMAVGVRVADCVPVLVGDEASGDVAAIHAGWRGVVAGVVASALARLGGRRLVAAIGPCIGPCCFEVGRDVGETIARAAPGARVVVAAYRDKAFADLRAAVRAQLLAAAPECRVEDVPGCTKHEAARFHSFRRDGANSGRMLAAIAARPPLSIGDRDSPSVM